MCEEMTPEAYAHVAASRQCQTAMKMGSASWPKSCPNCTLTGPCRFYRDSNTDTPVPLHLGGRGTLLEALVWDAVTAPLPPRRSDDWQLRKSVLSNAVAALRSFQMSWEGDEFFRGNCMADLAELLAGPAGAP